MLAGFARQFNSLSLPKAGVHFGLTSLLLLAGAGSVHDAAALNETRTLSFHHTHSNEDLTVTFKRDGRYDEEALKQLNHYLRDWRSQDQTTMDRHLFDILWEVYRDVDGKKPIQIISSYRSPATNAMLRRRSSGVARFSQHMLGHAMDFFIPDVPLEQIRFAGLRLQRGGVGFYPTSGSPFVHLDTGSIRHWPRMTHDQLVKVFPDGRTVHVPTDGSPLKGYELARADIEKRDGDDKAMTKNSPSLWTALFTKANRMTTRTRAQRSGRSAKRRRPMAAAAAQPNPPSPCRCRASKPRSPRPSNWLRPTPRSSSPQSRSRRRPHRLKKPKRNRQTPADIINARGFWGDAPHAEAGDARRRSPPSMPARRSPPPTRNRPPAFPPRSGAGLRAGSQFTASTAPISSRPARRCRAASGRHRLPRNLGGRHR